jgi:biotin-dependent carboxylase-like uncharacterized protein
MVKVIAPGFFSTIQDLGRMDYQEYGVPYSGVMDRYSAKLANALLGNDKNDALLEITMTGPKLQFDCDTYIVITGADMSPRHNGISIKQTHVVKIKPGDALSFGRLQFGFRGYLAVLGGLQSELVMHSRSMYNGITKQHKINKGDVLTIAPPSKVIQETNATIKINANHFIGNRIEVYKGPEFEYLTEKQQNKLLSTEFTISKDNSRMAYQLEEVLVNDLQPIITSLVLPGTVQLTPSGKLIILMRDCQTTGGYPRVLQLKGAYINVFSQKFTNNKIHFNLID